MKYLDKYPNCIGCPVKKWCGTMISCIRLCKSYQENKTEMNYEERYKQAIEAAKRELNCCGTLDCDAARQIFRLFPELRESEDERIRKAIIEHFEGSHSCMFPYKGFTKEQILAWLEKQGKQKSTDKVEPKFKVGDWVQIDGGNVMKILDVKKDALCYKILNWCGNESVRKISDIDSIAHLWTIQDAKPGDVLCAYPNADHPWIGIFCNLNDEGTFNSYCYLQSGQLGHFCPPSGENIFGKRNVDNHSSEDVVPATREQRDLFFQKMKEEGYEWNADNKELRKIEQIEQNPTWGEEDEKTRKAILELVKQSSHILNPMNQKSMISWLEKQSEKKDTVTPQWMVDFLKDHRRHFATPMDYDEKKETDGKLLAVIKWLEGNPQLEQNHVWSEEDEKMLDSIIGCIDGLCFIDSDQLNWLKSIKFQRHWKPSKEQMNALDKAKNSPANYYDIRLGLQSLYNDLKKTLI